jgi:hypothetical protein
MKHTTAAVLLGVLIGYLAHGHWAELEWFFRTLYM